MNDNAIAAVGGASRMALGGLAQRLVQDGLLDEASMHDAIVKSKEKRLSLVTHLVGANLATARDIAISASNEFGVPLLDLDAVALDMDAIRAVSDKLLQKHRKFIAVTCIIWGIGVGIFGILQLILMSKGIYI